MFRLFEMFQTPLMIVLVLILPLWLFLHYRLQATKAKHGVSDDDLQRLQHLQDDVKKLQERTQTLELILDEKVPEWRKI